MGTVILGKLESGSISKAQQLVMMPNRVSSPLCDFGPSHMRLINLLPEITQRPHSCIKTHCGVDRKTILF